MADNENQSPGGAADGNAGNKTIQDLAENLMMTSVIVSNGKFFIYKKIILSWKKIVTISWIFYTLKYIYMLLTLWTLPFIYAFGFMGATLNTSFYSSENYKKSANFI